MTCMRTAGGLAALGALAIGLCLSGCNWLAVPTPPPPPAPAFRISGDAESLPTEQRITVAEIVDANCGTPESPQLLGEPDRDALSFSTAAQWYNLSCSPCHGISGDGVGLIGDLLDPQARDFRRGVFKFQSTPYGAKPLRADIRRTIERGLPGSMMPAFGRRPAAEIDALVDYVILLSRRGELERQLVMAVDNGDTLTPQVVDDITAEILTTWKEAEGLVVQPLSPQPEFTAESVARGKAAFAARGCAKCHGEDGKGQTAENLRGGLKDYWGFSVRAADLTTGRLKGGSEPLDVYRRILGGINGTPMPSFRATLWTEPETIWDLVAYVLELGGKSMNH